MRGTGKFTMAEFMTCMSNDMFKRHLDARGIDFKDAEVFFKVVAAEGGAEKDSAEDGTGTDSGANEEVSIDSFVEGCMRLKGYATSLDLHVLTYETHGMYSFQKLFFTYCKQQFKSIKDSLVVLHREHLHEDHDAKNTGSSERTCKKDVADKYSLDDIGDITLSFDEVPQESPLLRPRQPFFPTSAVAAQPHSQKRTRQKT